MTAPSEQRDVYFIHHPAPPRAQGLSGEFAVHRDGRHLQGSSVRVLPEGTPLKLAGGESPISGPHKLDDVVFLTGAKNWLGGADVSDQMASKGFNAASQTAVAQAAHQRGLHVPPVKAKSDPAEDVPERSGIISTIPRLAAAGM